MKKILIIQTAFIGDVILATSLLEKLHFHYPDAQIDFLLRKGNESLLFEHPFLNKMIVWDKKQNKILNLFTIIKNIRKEKYDVIVNVQRFFSSGLFTVLGNAKKTIGFDKNPLSMFFSTKIKHKINDNNQHFLHEIERNNCLIEAITDLKIVKPKLYPTNNDVESVSFYKKNHYICIAPASVWFTKQYPMGKWIDLINNIDQSYTIFLLGSKSDKVLCNSIIEKVVPSKQNLVINLSGELNFLQSASLMKDAVINFVNDSGPLHIASAVNANVVAIFCSTIPSFGFGPLSDKSFIAENNDNLKCRPCGLHGYKQCPEKHFKCALEIDTKHLVNIIKCL